MKLLFYIKCVRIYKKLGCFRVNFKFLDEFLIIDRDLKSFKNDGYKLIWKEWEEFIYRFEV